VQIEPAPQYQVADQIVGQIVQGKSFHFYVRVVNTGMTDAQDVVLRIPLPEEFRGKMMGADWSTDWKSLAVEGREQSQKGKPTDWLVRQDTVEHQVILHAPVLAAGKEFYLLLEYPTIGPRGYEITGIVYAEKQEVTRKAQLIKP
jgi:hypothetical protein